jgi:hypothetical protein
MRICITTDTAEHWLAGDPAKAGLQGMAAQTQHSYVPKSEPFEFCSGGEPELQYHGPALRQYSYMVHEEHPSCAAARAYDLLIEQAQPWHGILHFWIPIDGSTSHLHISTTTPAVVALQGLRVTGVSTHTDYLLSYGALTDHGVSPLPEPIQTEDGLTLLTESHQPITT